MVIVKRVNAVYLQIHGENQEHTEFIKMVGILGTKERLF